MILVSPTTTSCTTHHSTTFMVENTLICLHGTSPHYHRSVHESSVGDLKVMHLCGGLALVLTLWASFIVSVDNSLNLNYS